MKKLISGLFLLVGLNAAAQDKTSVSEEKSSEWIKIGDVPVKPAPAVKRKSSTPKPATQPKPVAKESFDQTNNKVNRFKKGKKG